MTARYETARTDIVDRIVEQVARAAYVDSSGNPALSLSEYRANAAIRDAMAIMVRPNVEATLTALRAIAYSPDGFGLLDGMAQAEVSLRRVASTTTYDVEHKRIVDLNIPHGSSKWYGIDLEVGQSVVDLVLDRLALLPVDPRP